MCRYVTIPQTYSECAALRHHVIKVKHVVQCQAASYSLDTKTRICENLVPIARDLGRYDDSEEETGGCPACDLVALPITEASHSETFFATVVVSRLALMARLR